MRVIKDEKLEQINTQFEMDCLIEVSVRQKRSETVQEKFNKIHGLSIQYLKTI